MSVVVTEPVTNGLVLLHTTIGDISIELWPREAPKAVRNFVQLALEGYYDGVLFHRVVPGFIAQTGDPSGTGKGGECIYDEGSFEDEFNARLKFSRRGLVAMANLSSRNTNTSQFFFTLDRTDELQNRNTIFGRVGGDTLFNVLKLNDCELELGTERPVYPPVIKSVEVVDNPFPDIEPRITAKERKEQDKAKREMKLERAKQREASKRKGTKNAGLLSFGADPEEPLDPDMAKVKFKSSHDVLEDPRLRKEVKDDRGTSATLPPGMEGPQKRKVDQIEKSSERAVKADVAAASTSKLEAARVAQSKATINPNDKLRADIAKVQADLKKMAKGGHSSDEEEGKKSKKAKRTGPSLLQLEREKYKRGTAAATKGVDAKGKKVRREDEGLDEALAGFKSRILEAKSSAVPTGNDDDAGKPEGIWGANPDELNDEDNDEGWLSHSLVFRKDATLDQHSIDEYSTFDPLSKNSLSLDELKMKADNAGRKYSSREGGEGGAGKSGDGARRNDGGSSRGRDVGDRNRGGSSRGGRDQRSETTRPEVRGTSWKQNKMYDLA